MFVLNGKNGQSDWVLYSLHDAQGNLIYIGAEKFGLLLSLQEPLKNPAFDPLQNVTLQVLQLHEDKKAAKDALFYYLQRNPWPPLNKSAHVNHYGRVRNNRTGQEYKNAAEAAKAIGAAASQMSLHLRRVSGHRTIKGETFSYASGFDVLKFEPVQFTPRS